MSDTLNLLACFTTLGNVHKYYLWVVTWKRPLALFIATGILHFIVRPQRIDLVGYRHNITLFSVLIKFDRRIIISTVCPGSSDPPEKKSSDPFYIVTYCVSRK